MRCLQGRIFAGLYSDISPNWYKFVGSKLLATLVIQASLLLARPLCNYASRRLSRQRAQHALTQPDMNKCALVPRLYCLSGLLLILLFRS